MHWLRINCKPTWLKYLHMLILGLLGLEVPNCHLDLDKNCEGNYFTLLLLGFF